MGASDAAHVAALDLGSNSFHLVLYRQSEEGLTIIERRREQVQLRAGLDDEGNLSEDACERALAAIRRFAQILRPRPGLLARVAATNTFRKANNAAPLRAAIEETLGHPVEIISGEEEARLIFLGVTHTMPTGDRPAVVFDIGGGSTECILGRHGDVKQSRSFEMGCISWTKNFFPDGRFDRIGYDGAFAAAKAVLGPLADEWEEGIEAGSFIGASGTIRATERILRTGGWTTHGVTREGLVKVVRAVKKAGGCTPESLPGLKRSRASVFLGGLAILDALFHSFGIERMEVSHGAMREGIVHDLVSWAPSADRRPETMDAMVSRYRIDEVQAARVAETAFSLYKGVSEDWGLEDQSDRDALEQAARLHEIGLGLSFRHHHMHAAYILANTTMPGFSPRDRAVLAAIVGGQRGRLVQAPFRRIEGLNVGPGSPLFESLAPFVGGLLDDDSEEQRRALRLAVLLRLAALLNRDRSGILPDPLALSVNGDRLELLLPADWLELRPLTQEELEAEVSFLAAVDLDLRIEATPAADEDL